MLKSPVSTTRRWPETVPSILPVLTGKLRCAAFGEQRSRRVNCGVLGIGAGHQDKETSQRIGAKATITLCRVS